MKLSFIIVAFNSGPLIDNSLNSLKNQDYPHSEIEVILVDGLSTDDTKQKMLEFKNKTHDFGRIIVKDNPGKFLACGWNVALKEVTGEIILRVDAHTKFPKDFIRKNIECIENGEDICGGKVISILENDTPYNRVLLESENSMFGGGFTFFRRGSEAKYTSTLAFAAYRKEVFDSVGPYNENLVRTEDNDMHYRMKKNGYKFFFNPDIYSYRYCRSNFRALMKQKFLNGYWVGLTMGISPKAFSIFYFAPLCFVLGLIISIVFCFISPILFEIFIIAYTVVLILSLIAAVKKAGFYPEIILLPFIIFALHFVYGTGTIKGLIFIPKWRKNIVPIKL